MSRKKPKPATQTATTSVRLATDIVEMARLVAVLRHENLGEMVSGMLRPILVEAEKQEIAKRSLLP